MKEKVIERRSSRELGNEIQYIQIWAESAKLLVSNASYNTTQFSGSLITYFLYDSDAVRDLIILG